MYETHHLLLPDVYSVRATVTGNHPQLRDLLVYTPEHPDSVAVVCYDSIARLDLCGQAATQYTRLKFSPSSIATGCGLIAAGGQASELALMSADPKSNWCHQQTNVQGGCINNSLLIAPSLQSPAVPYVYVSNNDQTIKVYAVGGNIPDFRAAARRREEKSRQATLEEPDDDDWRATSGSESGVESGNESSVEEQGTYDQGGPCTLEQIESATLSFDTAINHTSLSKDGRRMVAVGDTNEVWLFDCMANGDYRKVHSFAASEDASFGTDWSITGDKFAVSSQDGFVHVYDVRFMPPPGTTRAASRTQRPRTIASIRSSQSGPAGAARKVKFSPGSSVTSELLSFSEHRSHVQVVDARTFDQVQVVRVPPSSMYPSISSAASAEALADLPPPPRPRPVPPWRSRERRTRQHRQSHGSVENLSDGERGGRPFIDGLYAERVRDRGVRNQQTRDEIPIRFQAVSRAAQSNTEGAGEQADEDIVMANDGDTREDILSPHRTDSNRQPSARRYASSGLFRRALRDRGDMLEIPPWSPFDEVDDVCPSEEETLDHAESTSRTTLNVGVESRSRGAGDYRWILPDPRARARQHDQGFETMHGIVRSLTSATNASPSQSQSQSQAPSRIAAHPSRATLSGYTPLPTWIQPIPPIPSVSPLRHPPTLGTGASPSSWNMYGEGGGGGGGGGSVSTSDASSLSSTGARSISDRTPVYFTSSPLNLDYAQSNRRGTLGLRSSTGTGAGAYQPNSLYFPLESTPSDLLGLDWSDDGTRMFVATEGRVWEYGVDERARRSFGAWGVR